MEEVSLSSNCLDMQFVITTEDPLDILSSTKSIVEDLRHITIHKDKLQDIATAIAAQLQKQFAFEKTTAGDINTLHDAVQITFLQDVTNFCFWAEKDKPKWHIEWPKGVVTTGGEFGLRKSFHRALAENVPILDATYLRDLTLEQTQSLFRGADDTQIPLIEKRWQNLKEAGAVLLEKYDGQFRNVLEKADYDSIELVKLLYKDFASFGDVAAFNNTKVYFLKRAQLVAKDIASLQKQFPTIQMKRTSLLTAFADYKLPQMLRKYGVMSYDDELTHTVDGYILIPASSREEVEIRATTIWSMELIRQQLPDYEVTDLAYALWLLSQDQTGVKPYHRTYTIYY